MRIKTLKKVFKKYGKNLAIQDKEGKCIITYPTITYSKPRRRVATAVTNPFDLISNSAKFWKRSLDSAGAKCSICGAAENIEMHHIKHLKKNKGRD